MGKTKVAIYGYTALHKPTKIDAKTISGMVELADSWTDYFYELIYKNANLFLNRKYNKFKL